MILLFHAKYYFFQIFETIARDEMIVKLQQRDFYFK